MKSMAQRSRRASSARCGRRGVIELRGEQGRALPVRDDQPFEQELALLLEPVFVAHAGGDLPLDEAQHRRDPGIVVLQRLVEFDAAEP